MRYLKLDDPVSTLTWRVSEDLVHYWFPHTRRWTASKCLASEFLNPDGSLAEGIIETTEPS